MKDQGGLPGLDLDYLKRDDATGTWTRFYGRNLGFDSRELRGEHDRQGNWRDFIDFSRIPRYEPFIVTTGLGLASAAAASTCTATPTTGSSITRRDRLGLGYDKQLMAGWDFQARYRTEEKTRVFGRGTDRPRHRREFRDRPHRLDRAAAGGHAGLRQEAPAAGRLLRHGLQTTRTSVAWTSPPAPTSPCRRTTSPTSCSLAAATASRRPPAATSSWPTPRPSRTMPSPGRRPVPRQHAEQPQGEGGHHAAAGRGHVAADAETVLAGQLRYEDRDDKTPGPVQTSPSTSDGFNSRSRAPPPRPRAKPPTCCRSTSA